MARRSLTALKIHQWLTEWDQITFDNVSKRRKPDPFFYFFSIKASELRKLSNIYRRVADQPRSEDLGVQREHKEERSIEISHFIKGGYPWSVLSKNQKANPENDKLKMPGWLPTSIIANILAPNTKIGSRVLTEENSVKIVETGDGKLVIELPENFENKEWKPDLFPISIIDGQHRLLAFDYTDEVNGDFELPVVAFYNIDITWQAYLFYTINIKPKKIKPSLAYDLFPILRTQDWLEKSPDGLIVYRETRAQELTEILWTIESSPWFKRINMLDQPGEGDVTQAAFIRSLLASMIKTSEVNETKIGGLFGSQINEVEVVDWDRLQQGAFLILVWQLLEKHISEITDPWALSLRSASKEVTKDLAFYGKSTLLSTDQGVRVFFHIINDTVFEISNQINLNEIQNGSDVGKREQVLEEQSINVDYILESIELFNKNTALSIFLNGLISCISHFDWRTSSAIGLTEAEKINKMAFRGSGGYRELRRQLLNHLIESGDESVKAISVSVKQKLGY